MESLEYDGCRYDLTAHGLVSEMYRRLTAIRRPEWNISEEPDEEQVERCMRWLRAYAKPRQSINRKIGSYSLKHVVENSVFAGYVTNGAFILAAHRLGLAIVPDGLLHPTAHFRLSFRLR